MSYNQMLVRVGAVVLAAMGAAKASAAIAGTLDDFQDLTTMGWSGWDPFISIKSDGGPAGNGDAYMRIDAAGGNGPGSRMATDNEDPRWSGNYLAAGITGLEADFLNTSASAMEIRAVVFGGSTNRSTSLLSSTLPADGQWHHLVFSLDDASMTVVMGTLTNAEILGDVTAVMFRHNSGAPIAGGTPVVGRMGIDNIHAIPAPGPAAALMVGAGVLTRRGGRRRVWAH